MAEVTQDATSLDALMKLVSLFAGSGKTTTTDSGGTTTSSSTVSAEGLQAILKQALESNQGLASVMGGEKHAGLYNSSTNTLLSNDLVTRLTAQAAANSKTATTTTPATTKTTQTGSALQGKTGTLASITGAGTLVNNLLKTAGNEKVKNVAGSAYDTISNLFSGGSDLTAASSAGAIGSSLGLTGAPAFSNAAAIQDTTAALGNSTDISSSNLISSLLGGASTEDATDGITNLFQGTNNFGQTAETVDTAVSGAEAVSDIGAATSDVAEAVSSGADTSFSTASAISSANSSSGNIAASAVEAYSPEATAEVSQSTLDAFGSSTGSSVSPYYESTAGIVYGDQTLSSAGSTLADASTVGTAAASTDIFGGSGSNIGYLASIYSAITAPNNPKGEMNPDYRKAVGSAVLNYFGFGELTPIVDAVARPVLNAAMDAGHDSLGNFGAVLADPIGAPLSGQYDVGDLITSTLDPGNILGGNEGGSVGGVVGMTIDPVGTALGGEGLAGLVSDGVNSIDSALSPGRVVCTELAMSGAISMEMYREVIKPDVTLTGRILLGYHMLGVPAVRKLRTDPAFVDRALPWVTAYLQYKLGKRSWRGGLVKYIGEPLCWILSFFNTDPDYYKVLYPYRRDRKV